MFAVIGLGNPGSKYEATRHNAGFWVADRLHERLAKAESWKTHGACLCLRAQIASIQVLLVKPQKYMNLSGEAAQPLLQFFKVPSERLVVVYDDLDLPPGRIQIRRGGSAAGHNGLTDIIQRLGTEDFFRLRVGVGRTEVDQARVSGRNWVLGVPGPNERELLEKAVTFAAEAVETLVVDGLERAQQQFNKK